MSRRIVSVPLKHEPEQIATVPGGERPKALGVRLAGDTPTLLLLGDPTADQHEIVVRRYTEGDAVPSGHYLGHTQEQVGAPVYFWFASQKGVEP